MSLAVTEEREQAYYFQMALQPSCSRLIQNAGHSDQGVRVTGRIDVHLMRQGSLFMALFIFSSDVLSTWEVFQMNKEAWSRGLRSLWQDIPESLKTRAKLCSASSAERPGIIRSTVTQCQNFQ